MDDFARAANGQGLVAPDEAGPILIRGGSLCFSSGGGLRQILPEQ